MIEKQKEEWKDDHYYYFGVVPSHFALEILLYFETFQKYGKMQSMHMGMWGWVNLEAAAIENVRGQ